MFRRLVPLLAFAILAAAPAGSALATVPVCTADTGTLRYRPEYTASCPGQTITAVELVKTSNGAAIGFTPTGVGTSDLTVDVNGTLASNMQYRLKLTVDDGSGAALWTQTFRTLKAPAHPGLHVKYITAIPADAVLDMAHRIDAANVFAVPRTATSSTPRPRASPPRVHRGAQAHQSALVVTDLPVLNPAGLGTRSPGTASHGTASCSPGRRTGSNGGDRAGNGERDRRAGERVGSKWAMYTYEDVTPTALDRRAPARARLGAAPLPDPGPDPASHVIGPGSGEPIIQDYARGTCSPSCRRELRAVLPHVPAGVPGRAPDRRRPRGRPRLPAVVVATSRAAASTRPRAPAARSPPARSGGRRTASRRPTPISPQARQPVHPGDGHLRPGRQGRRHGRLPRPALPLPGRPRQLERAVGTRSCSTTSPRAACTRSTAARTTRRQRRPARRPVHIPRGPRRARLSGSPSEPGVPPAPGSVRPLCVAVPGRSSNRRTGGVVAAAAAAPPPMRPPTRPGSARRAPRHGRPAVAQRLGHAVGTPRPAEAVQAVIAFKPRNAFLLRPPGARRGRPGLARRGSAPVRPAARHGRGVRAYLAAQGLEVAAPTDMTLVGRARPRPPSMRSGSA